MLSNYTTSTSILFYYFFCAFSKRLRPTFEFLLKYFFLAPFRFDFSSPLCYTIED